MGPARRSPGVRRPGNGRSGCLGAATTGIAGRTAGCCLRRRSRRSCGLLPACIPPGTGARRPSAICMLGTCRSCSARLWTGRSQRRCAGGPKVALRAARACPSVSPRPTASRCSISDRCRRGPCASAWPQSAAPNNSRANKTLAAVDRGSSRCSVRVTSDYFFATSSSDFREIRAPL